jgi:hypothetical protein
VGSITTDCGWLSPTGQWHPCCEEGHKNLARDLLEQLEPGKWRGPGREHFGDPEYELEQRGWVKLIPRGFRDIGFAGWGWEHELTPAQSRALLEWCLGDGQGRTELPACLMPDWGPEEGAA